jgi:hypothetical protein
MNATYASFMTALLVEYAHDQLADNISSECNVTWSRTSPAIVSVCNEYYQSYLTLDCDHSMGMTAVGTPGNIWTFNYITSSSISPIEYDIMNDVTGNNYQSCSYDGYFGSVTTDLINDYLTNNTSVEIFMQNGYIIEKSANNDYEFLVIDPETGIVRDINTINNFCGLSTAPYDNCLECIIDYLGFKDFACNEDPWIFPDFPVYWDGLGSVFIGSNWGADPSVDQISSWGQLEFSTNLGSITFNNDQPSDAPIPGKDVDITRILAPKTVTFLTLTDTVIDTGNDWIGGSGIYVNEVSLTMPPWVYASNSLGLLQDLIDGKEKFNGGAYAAQWFDTAGAGLTSLIDGLSLVSPVSVYTDIDLFSRLDTLNSINQQEDDYQNEVNKLNNTPLFIKTNSSS